MTFFKNPKAEEKVSQAMRALGDDVSYNRANKWIVAKYSVGVSDATFYKSRQAIRIAAKREATKAPVLVPTGNEVSKDVTLSDLQKVQSFAKEVGGRVRLTKILSVLESLTQA